MIAVIVLIATVACAYLAMRLHAARVEIADLRSNIAQLKRRLLQRE